MHHVMYHVMSPTRSPCGVCSLPPSPSLPQYRRSPSYRRRPHLGFVGPVSFFQESSVIGCVRTMHLPRYFFDVTT